MQDLVRGWAIFWEHQHLNLAVAVAILTPLVIAVWVGLREKKDEKPDVEDFRPIERTPIQGSDKDYRRGAVATCPPCHGLYLRATANGKS